MKMPLRSSSRRPAHTCALLLWLCGALGLLGAGCSGSESAAPESSAKRLNLLLVVADDLNWNSVGAYGSTIEGITPNIDRLASEGMRFEHAHVNVSVCQPSRHVLLTGRYSHNCGGEGFFNLRRPGVPLLPGVLQAAGYRVGAMGKIKHSTPYADFPWDVIVNRKELGMGRNPSLFAKAVREFIESSQAADQPWFLMANSHDPHRPFYGDDVPSWYDDAEYPVARPSREFSIDECPVPDFLPSLEPVRREVVNYYNTVRRCDDAVGALLETLEQTGAKDDTVVIFLSDNGMSFPFAKASCYLNSTRVPWIVRWPGRVTAGAVCREEMISGVDLMPTLLEVAGVEAPPGMDGRSFVELLDGQHQSGRDYVFTQYGQSSNGDNVPMRCVQSKEFGYIFNPWSDGTRRFERGEDENSRTFLAMETGAAADADLARRVEFLLERVPEELYDFRTDPDALRNRIADPSYAAPLEELRRELEAWMVRYEDPALTAFRMRDSPEVVDAFLSQMREALGQ